MSWPPPPSLWPATGPDDVVVARRLDGDLDVDVAIVGAGYTGLWTALSLLEAEPALRVVVVERHHVGFGASGRNGGWCSALLPISLTALERRHGREAAIAWQRAMIDTVDDVGRFAARQRGGRPRHPVPQRRDADRRPQRRPAAAGSRRQSPRRGGSASGTDDVRLLDAIPSRRPVPRRGPRRRDVHAALRGRPPAAARSRHRRRGERDSARASSRESTSSTSSPAG